MKKTSAGLLMFRVRDNKHLEVLLVHPGGPFWSRKDQGSWFIPKGEVRPGEDTFEAAQREFKEETGLLPGSPTIPLGSVKHRSGKTVYAWAFQGDCDPKTLRSNTFKMEWPPGSGKIAEFPEVDRAEFFSLEEARTKLHPDEVPFLDRLYEFCTTNGLIEEN